MEIHSGPPPVDSEIGLINIEQMIVELICHILNFEKVASIGKLGSLLHTVTGNHILSSWLKEKYGGLKKLIELNMNSFNISLDHPFNPTVSLKIGGEIKAETKVNEDIAENCNTSNTNNRYNSPKIQISSPKLQVSGPLVSSPKLQVAGPIVSSPKLNINNSPRIPSISPMASPRNATTSTQPSPRGDSIPISNIVVGPYFPFAGSEQFNIWENWKTSRANGLGPLSPFQIFQQSHHPSSPGGSQFRRTSVNGVLSQLPPPTLSNTRMGASTPPIVMEESHDATQKIRSSPPSLPYHGSPQFNSPQFNNSPNYSPLNHTNSSPRGSKVSMSSETMKKRLVTPPGFCPVSMPVTRPSALEIYPPPNILHNSQFQNNGSMQHQLQQNNYNSHMQQQQMQQQNYINQMQQQQHNIQSQGNFISTSQTFNGANLPPQSNGFTMTNVMPQTNRLSNNFSNSAPNIRALQGGNSQN